MQRLIGHCHSPDELISRSSNPFGSCTGFPTRWISTLMLWLQRHWQGLSRVRVSVPVPGRALGDRGCPRGTCNGYTTNRRNVQDHPVPPRSHSLSQVHEGSSGPARRLASMVGWSTISGAQRPGISDVRESRRAEIMRLMGWKTRAMFDPVQRH